MTDGPHSWGQLSGKHWLDLQDLEKFLDILTCWGSEPGALIIELYFCPLLYCTYCHTKLLNVVCCHKYCTIWYTGNRISRYNKGLYINDIMRQRGGGFPKKWLLQNLAWQRGEGGFSQKWPMMTKPWRGGIIIIIDCYITNREKQIICYYYFLTDYLVWTISTEKI